MRCKVFRKSARTLLLLLALIVVCAGAAHADSFQTGEFVTYPQGLWASPISNPGAAVLLAGYPSVYASSSDLLFIGLPSTGFALEFDSAVAIFDYLPASGNPAPLTQSLTDPLTTPSGNFGGDVLALQLNVDFSNAGLLAHPAGVPFGNLVLQNFGIPGPNNTTVALPALNGLAVSQFLGDANTCLGGGTCIYTPADLELATAVLNFSFNSGAPSPVADTILALPTSTVPEPSSLLLLGSGLASLGFLRRRFLHA